MNTLTITVPSAALGRLLSDTWRFASALPELPALRAVHLSVAGGHLVAMGTDRMVLAWSRYETDAPEGFRAAIPRETARRWAEILAEDPDVEATLTAIPSGDGGPPLITLARAGWESSAGGIRPLFADLTPLMDALLTAEPTALPGVLIDSLKLAPFTAVAATRVPPPPPNACDEDGWPAAPRVQLPVMAVTPVVGPGGPLLRITIGRDFLGALMGANTADHGVWWEIAGAEQWRAVVGEQVPA